MTQIYFSVIKKTSCSSSLGKFLITLRILIENSFQPLPKELFLPNPRIKSCRSVRLSERKLSSAPLRKGFWCEN
jgi:hypothetical protein